VGGITRDTTIHIVSEPLPIDDLWVELDVYRNGRRLQPEDWCPACQVSYDARLRLEKVLMPVGGSLPFEVHGSLEGARVWPMRSTVASTDDGATHPSETCRPSDLDPDCDERQPYWISALSPGAATVSVTARNLTIFFEVEVTDSL
jgi:hypothetical protein